MMKKFLFVLFFVMMVLTSNAQLFVAGSVAAKFSGGRTEHSVPMLNVTNVVDDPKEFGFSVKPAVGYMIPEKSYGFGLSLGYAYNSVRNDGYAFEYNKMSYNIYEVAPFFRYAYARFGKITLYADLKVPVSVGKVKEKYGDAASDVEKNFAVGARLIPGLTYKFNDHILFTTEIGLLSINYMHSRSILVSTDVVKIDDDFDIGANNRAVASFGFVYLF